ncbi:MAG: hypothetical protein MI976_31710 [Pseudomonadales bacterium]|nr:hypothetical protein [Pseudomonadales bacterium]
MSRKLYLSIILCCGPFASGSLYAETVRVDFSALVSDASGYDEYFPDGQVTGYLTYDTDIMWSGTDPGSSDYAFDSLSFSDYPFAQFYINELDQSFQLDYGNLYGGSFMNLGAVEHQPYPDETPYLSALLDIGTGSIDPLFLNDPGQLPTQFNQDAIDAGDVFGYFGVSPDDGSPGSLWSLSFNTITVSNVVADAPIVLNSLNFLVFGGNGLATASHLDASFGDLTTSRTIIGFENHAIGEFTQSSNSHLTSQLNVGGDSDSGDIGFGTYSLEDGILETQKTVVGDFGAGLFLQAGGEHYTQRLVIGNAGFDDGVNGPIASGFGRYELSAGLLETETTQVGVFGRSTFVQTGGIHRILGSDADVAALIIGDSVSTHGTFFSGETPNTSLGRYQLSGGNLVVSGSSVVGGATNRESYNASVGGLGYFNQTGGSFETDELLIGQSTGYSYGTGYYRMDDGLLTVNENLQVGSSEAVSSDSSEFVQTAGAVNVAGNLAIHSGFGFLQGYRIQGGTTTANDVVVGSDHPPEGLRSATLEVSDGGTLETARGVTAHQDAIVSLDGGSIMGDVTLRGAQLLLSRSSGNNSIDGFVDLSAQATLVLDYQNEAEQVLLDTSEGIYLANDTMLEIMLGFVPTENIAIEDFFGGSSSVYLTLGEENVYFTFASGLALQDGAVFNYSLNGVSYEFAYSAVPLPAAAWMFLSGLLSVRLLRKSKNGKHP